MALPKPIDALSDIAFNDGETLSTDEWLKFLYGLQEEIENEIIAIMAEKQENNLG